MDRQAFLRTCGKGAVGAALAAVLGVRPAGAAEGAATTTAAPAAAAGPGHTCEQRIAFAERWVGRFMKVLDDGLDAPTRARLMEANGKSCFEGWLRQSGTVIEPIAFPEWVEKIEASGPREDIRVEGRTVHFQYVRNTKGEIAPEGFCLCDLLESKPDGISPTYCHCSVGYVRELFSRRFGQPVTVTLVDSVLRGGRRCRFRIDLA